MKIHFDSITACGECCTGCRKKAEGLCEGCVESDGHCAEWTQSGGCPIHRCTREHGVGFCGLCGDFPCEWLAKTIVWRPDALRELKELADRYRQREE